MYNQLLISLQIEEKWYTFRLFLVYFHVIIYNYLNSIHYFEQINIKNRAVLTIKDGTFFI